MVISGLIGYTNNAMNDAIDAPHAAWLYLLPRSVLNTVTVII